MSANLKTVEVINKIADKFKNDESKYFVFRGLPNSNWLIESSAARRLKNNKQSNQADFIKYHQVLLDDAKKGNYKGVNAEDLRNMYDLEILAQIQHLGGATCLTDFSSNLLISLWFATAPHKEDNGETDAILYVINLKSLKNIDMFRDIKDIKDSYKNTIVDLLTYRSSHEAKKEHFWYWKPRIMNGRINNQNSIFLFGLPKISEKLYKSVTINKNDKSKIRQELSEYFGINVNTVYPDLMGFSNNANNYTAMFNDFFSMKCIDIAISYLNENNYENCERYINDMKKCPSQQDKEETELFEKKEITDQSLQCRRRGTDRCATNKADIEYLSGKCLYSKFKFEYDESKKNHIVINNDRIKISYIEAINKLSSAISDGTQFAYDCICVLIDCYYEIESCTHLFLKEDNSEIFEILLRTRKLYYNLISELRSKDLVLIDKSEDLRIEFSILELSIMALDLDTFTKQISLIENMHTEGNSYFNSYLLLEFFKIVGKYVFNNSKNSCKLTQKDITFKIKKMNKEIEENLGEIQNIYSFSITWNFDDIKIWLSNYFIKEDNPLFYDNLQIFCNEIAILQNEIKLAMFEKEELPY
jgi:FRG domain.